MTERLDPYEIYADDELDGDLLGLTWIEPPVRELQEQPDRKMSAAERQRTCAACGGQFEPGERTGLETVVDTEVLYVAVHAHHSTYPARRETEVAQRLSVQRPSTREQTAA